MVNERNLGALGKALIDAKILVDRTGPQEHLSPEALRGAAEGLAARIIGACGALVPSTLTEREADFLVLGIDHGRNMLPEGPEVGKGVRDVLADRLRRIAVGDAP